MKVLWITNVETPVISQYFSRNIVTGGWIHFTSKLLADKENINLHIASYSHEYQEVSIDKITYFGFVDSSSSSKLFKMIEDYEPDIIHIWGTEYNHFLDVVRFLKEKDLLSKTVVSIQGLVSEYYRYYCFMLPEKIVRKKTIYEWLRHAAITDSKKSFFLRGIREKEGLSLVENCIGRTDWDKAILRHYNPNIKYYKCYEILREGFYSNAWEYENCEKHSIVFSQSGSILKGFHLMVDALEIVKRFYPDVKLYAVGKSPFVFSSMTEKIKRYTFLEYVGKLIKQKGLEDNIRFMGMLDEKQMIEHYKRGNVFVCASGIENSSNSIGEAMMLGMPIVASDVGGVKTFIHHEIEGILYQSDSVHMLADGIIRMFENEKMAIEMGRKAKERARAIFDYAKNIDNMVKIYEKISNV